MGITFIGGNFSLDSNADKRIINLANNELKSIHAQEYAKIIEKFREMVFIEEVALMKTFLERRHPEQVDMIFKLREILNHERKA